MAQIINDSSELLDGGQIYNKLWMCLKAGQSNFASNDLQLYDKGQIATKYNVNWTDVFSISSDNRLIPHLGYTPILSLKGPYFTPKEGYNSTTWTPRIYFDTTFNGQSPFQYVVNGVLYDTYNKVGDNVPASAGNYVYSQTNPTCYYLVVNSSGVITNMASFTLDTFNAYFTYAGSDTPYDVDVHDIVTELNGSGGWAGTAGTIWRRASNNLWYNSYNSSDDSWGSLVSALYVGYNDTLLYNYKRILNGALQSEGIGYKNNTFSISYTNTMIAGGGNITVTINSTIKWQAQITAGSGYASITSTTYGDGNGSVTINIASNSGAARNVSFSITDRMGLLSAQNGTIYQNAYTLPRTATNYFGYDLASETDAYYSGYPNFSLMGTIWDENGTYYTTETGSTLADVGFYLVTVGGSPSESGYINI